FAAFNPDMNLIVDIGNTLAKIAVFQEDKLVEKMSVPLENFEEAQKNISQNYSEIQKCVLSSVGRLPKEVIISLESDYRVFIVNSRLKFPFDNKYKTPLTLGVDRLALVTAASKQYANQNVLIIDAGSCITYDFLSEKNHYLGGAISPGIRLRYNALHNFTANL